MLLFNCEKAWHSEVEHSPYWFALNLSWLSAFSFYNSLFSLPNFSQFYNNSNLTISIRSEGTSFTSSFPLIKTLYTLSKTELKSGTNCYDLMQYMYNVDLRKYWDGVIERYDAEIQRQTTNLEKYGSVHGPDGE